MNHLPPLIRQLDPIKVQYPQCDWVRDGYRCPHRARYGSRCQYHDPVRAMRKREAVKAALVAKMERRRVAQGWQERVKMDLLETDL